MKTITKTKTMMLQKKTWSVTKIIITLIIYKENKNHSPSPAIPPIKLDTTNHSTLSTETKRPVASYQKEISFFSYKPRNKRQG